MKYEIDTIPVWDALKENTECLLCLLEKKSRTRSLAYYLGDSVMVPEIRVKVNETGFSPQNWRILSKDPNRLGLGLITSTYLMTLRQKLLQKSRALAGQGQKLSETKGLQALSASKAPLKKTLDEFLSWLNLEQNQCLIEGKVQTDLQRYFYTAAKLFADDKDFAAAFRESKGVCLHHLGPFLTLALQHLSAPQAGALAQLSLELLQKSLGSLEKEVLHFTSMYDSRNSGQDWGQSKDAIERSLLKINGVFPEWEDEKKSRR